jgi:hypothetical protein
VLLSSRHHPRLLSLPTLSQSPIPTVADFPKSDDYADDCLEDSRMLRFTIVSLFLLHLLRLRRRQSNDSNAVITYP